MTRTAFISLKIRKKSSKIINTTVFLTILTNIFKSGVMPQSNSMRLPNIP